MIAMQGVAELALPKHDAPRLMYEGSPRSWLVAVVAGVVAACAATPQPSAREVADANDTGQALAAKSEQERAVLREAASLPSGVARRINGTNVLAEAPYVAASGRTCRALQLSEQASQAIHRLACSDGKAWFFVPDVFGSNGHDSKK